MSKVFNPKFTVVAYCAIIIYNNENIFHLKEVQVNDMRRVIFIFLMVIMAAALNVSGCSREEPVVGGNEGKITVAVSIVPQETFVRAVAGDLVDVVVMVPPGNSPGNYEPTPREIEKFSRASFYFAIGVPTESANIMPHAEEVETMTIIKLHEIVAESFPERALSKGCCSECSRDPHIWLSPSRAAVMVHAMAGYLSEVDEENRELFKRNARNYIARLEELDSFLNATFSGLDKKEFIVFHPAFGYLADDYGLKMHALEADGKEATPRRLEEMVDLAREKGIEVIFYQAEIDSPQSEAFAEEIGGRTVRLAPLDPDYIENLKKMAETMAGVMN